MLNYHTFLLEKSSLPSIGVPIEIMQIVQHDYEFNPNTNWNRSEKQDIISFPEITRWNQSNLFVGISEERIFFIFSYRFNDKTYYNYDEFNKIEDDFGEGWERDTEIKVNLKDIIMKIIGFNGNIWYTSAQDYKLTSKIIRKIQDIDKIFKDKTEDFKEKVTDKLKLLGIFLLKNPKEHGLSMLDEIIIEFEEKYSDLKNKYITISDLINEYGIDKVVRQFIYFFKNKKLL